MFAHSKVAFFASKFPDGEARVLKTTDNIIILPTLTLSNELNI